MAQEEEEEQNVQEEEQNVEDELLALEKTFIPGPDRERIHALGPIMGRLKPRTFSEVQAILSSPPAPEGRAEEESLRHEIEGLRNLIKQGGSTELRERMTLLNKMQRDRAVEKAKGKGAKFEELSPAEEKAFGLAEEAVEKEREAESLREKGDAFGELQAKKEAERLRRRSETRLALNEGRDVLSATDPGGSQRIIQAAQSRVEVGLTVMFQDRANIMAGQGRASMEALNQAELLNSQELDRLNNLTSQADTLGLEEPEIQNVMAAKQELEAQNAILDELQKMVISGMDPNVLELDRIQPNAKMGRPFSNNFTPNAREQQDLVSQFNRLTFEALQDAEAEIPELAGQARQKVEALNKRYGEEALTDEQINQSEVVPFLPEDVARSMGIRNGRIPLPMREGLIQGTKILSRIMSMVEPVGRVMAQLATVLGESDTVIQEMLDRREISAQDAEGFRESFQKIWEVLPDLNQMARDFDAEIKAAEEDTGFWSVANIAILFLSTLFGNPLGGLIGVLNRIGKKKDKVESLREKKEESIRAASKFQADVKTLEIETARGFRQEARTSRLLEIERQARVANVKGKEMENIERELTLMHQFSPSNLKAESLRSVVSSIQALQKTAPNDKDVIDTFQKVGTMAQQRLEFLLLNDPDADPKVIAALKKIALQATFRAAEEAE